MNKCGLCTKDSIAQIRFANSIHVIDLCPEHLGKALDGLGARSQIELLLENEREKNKTPNSDKKE